MNGLWDILSVAIGVSFVFMILSILNSWIQDYVATIFHIRANNLADIMQVLLEPNAIKLDGKGMAKKEPPKIEDFYADKHKIPAKYKTVEKNTLNDVAAKFKVSIDDLRNDNFKILDDLSLKNGTTLTIPDFKYTVGKNETLDEIAKKFDDTAKALEEQNREVFYGLSLTISGARHKVGVNDTLNDVAAKYKVSSEELLKANIEALSKWLEKLKKESTDASTNVQKSSDETSLHIPPSSSNTKVDASLGNIAQKAAQMAKEAINPNLKYLDAKLPPDTTELTLPEFSYTVGKNDTLNKTAGKFKISINKMVLPIGTKLIIPEAKHTVKDNETLSKIAKDTNRLITDLRKANPTVFDDLSLPVGTSLNIPDPEAGRYKVQENDKMRDIALQQGISFDELQKKNPDARDPLQAGTTLYIPKPEIGQMVSRKNVLSQLITNPVGSLYRHPIIHSLSKPGELPDRIPTKDFTVALLDLLDDIGKGKNRKNEEGKRSGEKINIKNIIEGINSLEKEGGTTNAHPLAFRLRSLLYTAQINTQIKKATDDVDASLEEFQKAVSEWFDDTVARGSVWYKRRMQRIGILFGILLAVVLNADTIGISNALWHNAVLRESISQAAEATTQQGQAPDSEQAQAQLEELMNLGLPIGWSLDGNPDDPRAIPSTTEGWISKSIGLLLTGFAISQGSQLWFDLINRLINIRSSVSKSDTDEAPSKSKG